MNAHRHIQQTDSYAWTTKWSLKNETCLNSPFLLNISKNFQARLWPRRSFAHVTYFFDCGRGTVVSRRDSGEDELEGRTRPASRRRSPWWAADSRCLSFPNSWAHTHSIALTTNDATTGPARRQISVGGTAGQMLPSAAGEGAQKSFTN